MLNLLVLFICVPLVELYLLFKLAEHTSIGATLLIVILTGVVGTWLARSQGWRTYQRIQREIQGGHVPTTALLDAAMIFVAGALLLTPGILTDLFGLSLLIPFFRRRYRVWAARWIKRHFHVVSASDFSGTEGRSRIIDSYVSKPEQDDQP